MRKFLIVVILCFLVVGCDSNFKQSMGITSDNFNKLDMKGRRKLISDYQLTSEKYSHRSKPKVMAKHALHLEISGGSAMFISKELRLPYHDISLTIEPNKCNTIDVKARDNSATSPLEICFWGNELQLDPSKINPKFAFASARIFYSSLWRDFTYKNINTFGYVSFKDISIRITMV